MGRKTWLILYSSTILTIRSSISVGHRSNFVAILSSSCFQDTTKALRNVQSMLPQNFPFFSPYSLTLSVYHFIEFRFEVLEYICIIEISTCQSTQHISQLVWTLLFLWIPVLRYFNTPNETASCLMWIETLFEQFLAVWNTYLWFSDLTYAWCLQFPSCNHTVIIGFVLCKIQSFLRW